MGFEQKTHLKVLRAPTSSPLAQALDIFFLDCRARRLAVSSVAFYKRHLGGFTAFVEGQGVTALDAVTPSHIRAYLVSVHERNLKDNTVHGAARSIRAFFNFAVAEELLAETPMRKVKMPKVGKQILPAFTPDDIRKLLTACYSGRDRAIVLALLDSGCRAAEFVALDVGHVNRQTGTITVKEGKGKKDRTTFLGTRARKELAKYPLTRGESKADDPLLLNEHTGQRLTVWGLSELLGRLGARAGVGPCGAHMFRRTCATWSLRSGMNIYALQQIMGHSDLFILRRYLALVEEDLADAHRKYGAVDNML
jgi:site-specific recombinase XerD